MPTERRKIQNRVNQRRYRTQMKNRIQMLEKAIIDSGVATGLDIGIPRTTATKDDRTSSEPQSFSTPFSYSRPAPEPEIQNMGHLDLDSSPDSLDEEIFFIGQDFFEDWTQPEYALMSDTSSLSTPDSTRQPSVSVSHSSLQWGLPWQEPSTPQSQTPDLILSPILTNLNDYESTTSQPRKESNSKSARGRPRKSVGMEDSNEPKKPRTMQRRARDTKEKTLSSLKEENKRLKELSVALVNMYYATGKTALSDKELPLGHNLQATANNFITRSSANKLPNNALDYGAAVSNPIPGSLELFEDGQLHTLDEPVVTQLPMRGAQALANPKYHSSPNDLSTTLLFSALPLPSSHAYLEPTFPRRLVRLLWEHAFKTLTLPSTTPAQLEYRFGFCLRSRTKETLIQKFLAYLGLSGRPITELDRQVWNSAPDVRDTMERGSDEWGYWIEAGKVETYLESLGFSLAEKVDQRLLERSPAASLSRCPAESPETGSEAVQVCQQAPQVCYGSKWQPDARFINSLFDDEGDFRAPASWCTPDAVDPAASPVTPPHINNERFVKPGSEYYVNVDDLCTGLREVSFCLGRAAGFRRTDVDKVIKKSLVKY